MLLLTEREWDPRLSSIQHLGEWLLLSGDGTTSLIGSSSPAGLSRMRHRITCARLCMIGKPPVASGIAREAGSQRPEADAPNDHVHTRRSVPTTSVTDYSGRCNMGSDTT